MKKTIDILFVALLLCIFTAISSDRVSAHPLNPWAVKYSQINAGGDNHFAFEQIYHVDGDTMNYYYDNAYTESLWSTTLTGGVAMWGGMVKVNKTSSSLAHVRIEYDAGLPKAGTGINYGEGHYSVSSGNYAVIVMNDIRNEPTLYKNQVMAHELAHVWGHGDLYKFVVNGVTYYKNNLDSIMSRPYSFTSATRHDMNAMYIGLNNPWYDTGNSSARWKYQKELNNWVTNAWYFTDTYFYRFNSAGVVTDPWVYSGFFEMDGSHYYLSPTGGAGQGRRVVKGWQAYQYGPNWYWAYLDPDANGKMVKGMKQIGNDTYYFRESGADVGRMETGWILYQSNWYYFDPSSGKMATGWLTAGGDSYYMKPAAPNKGSRQTGWINYQYGSDWFWAYCDPGNSGKMVSGFKTIGGDTYYFRETSPDKGRMLTEWQRIGGNSYYFLPGDNGRMLTGTHVVGGITRNFKTADPNKGALLPLGSYP